VPVSHTSSGSNSACDTTATTDTAHNSISSTCSQRHRDASSGATMLSTYSCEESNDDTPRDSREPSDAAAAAAAAAGADATASSIVVTSTQSPRRSVLQSLHTPSVCAEYLCGHCCKFSALAMQRDSALVLNSPLEAAPLLILAIH
jgi:hypothetical protein